LIVNSLPPPPGSSTETDCFRFNLGLPAVFGSAGAGALARGSGLLGFSGLLCLELAAEGRLLGFSGLFVSELSAETAAILDFRFLLLPLLSRRRLTPPAAAATKGKSVLLKLKRGRWDS
jgi:hypothetical protein